MGMVGLDDLKGFFQPQRFYDLFYELESPHVSLAESVTGSKLELS